MHVLGLAALVAVATLWSGAFVMWVLGLPRNEARGPHSLSAQVPANRRRD